VVLEGSKKGWKANGAARYRGGRRKVGRSRNKMVQRCERHKGGRAKDVDRAQVTLRWLLTIFLGLSSNKGSL
jgi:hypothetical protein